MFVWQTGRLAVHSSCVAKTWMLDITRKLFNQIVHTCHVYRHYWLLSFHATCGGHKVRAKQNLSASYFCTLFIWSGCILMRWWCNSSWTSWGYLWVRFMEARGITVLLTAPKTFNVGMHAFGRSHINLISTGYGYDDRYYSTLHCDTSQADLDFDSRSQECEKANTLAPMFSVDFNGTGLLLRLDHVMNLILFVLYSDIYRSISFRLGVMIETTMLTVSY